MRPNFRNAASSMLFGPSYFVVSKYVGFKVAIQMICFECGFKRWQLRHRSKSLWGWSHSFVRRRQESNTDGQTNLWYWWRMQRINSHSDKTAFIFFFKTTFKKIIRIVASLIWSSIKLGPFPREEDESLLWFPWAVEPLYPTGSFLKILSDLRIIQC